MIAEPFLGEDETGLLRGRRRLRLIATGINCLIWLTGLLLLHWGTYEVHAVYTLNILLHLAFCAFRIIASLDGQPRFASGLFGRIYFAGIVFVFGSGIGLVMGGIVPDRSFFWWLVHSPNHWAYTFMVLNYCGYFFHDFLYNGTYKKSTAALEGVLGFFGMLILAFSIILIEQFAGPKGSASFDIWWAVGIIFSQLVLEAFYSYNWLPLFIKKLHG